MANFTMIINLTIEILFKFISGKSHPDGILPNGCYT
jgi:hypothetical protein